MPSRQDECFIYVQPPRSLRLVTAARLRVAEAADGSILGTFIYGQSYLASAAPQALDPYRLPLGRGPLAFTKLKGVPGAVRDAGPDYWGRLVIENRLGRIDLSEVDYLLNGPEDGAGNIVFGRNVTPPPPARIFNRTIDLERLLAAAETIEAGRPLPPQLAQTIDPGTSMGGARPKVVVRDDDTLWLAKFPERRDPFNVPRVEHATLELARACGINAAVSRLETVAGRDVLLVRRFDRAWAGDGFLRHRMVSGLTVLDADDSHLDRASWSYLRLAEELRRWSSRPAPDQRELFRRIAFNALVTNNDDHPRNHALIDAGAGWHLSPAYDLVPKPLVSLERRDLALEVGRYGRRASKENLLSRADIFGLSGTEADAILSELEQQIGTWREVFARTGVSAADIEHVAGAVLPPSFYLCEGDQIRFG